ncbi:MAG: hypothetical protein JJ863_19870 [Deltaproteobacteria bacterium]|nr:hypothetical protein [Deltaproteobacteria bacterium]
MKLPIVGEAAPEKGATEWPAPSATNAPTVVIHDARGGMRDRDLLAALREAGWKGPVLLTLEGAPLREPLPPELGPGELVRGRGVALVEAAMEAAGPPVALGAGAARAFAADLSIRVDPGLRAGALPPILRGMTVDLTLREGWVSVLLPLMEGALDAAKAR